jgi:hypothetical protein
MDTIISNVSEKLVVGQVDTSFLTLSSKFKPGTAVLNGPVYMGELTGSIGLDRATCTIGPPLPGLSFPASLEVDGITNIFGVTTTAGIINDLALSNIFGFTNKIGAEIQAAFKQILGLKSNAAVQITQGPKVCQAVASAPLVVADEGLFGDILATGDITGPTIDIIYNEIAWLNAHKKSFDIPHPTKEGWRLRHVCIEGPTADVYVRGKLKDSNVIELPEYWRKLVDPETITVTLTPIGAYQELYVDEIEWGTRIIIKTNSGSSINCYYTVYGERADTDKNIPEYEGTYNDYPGDNGQYTPYGTAIVQ